jgi:ribosomal protein S26
LDNIPKDEAVQVPKKENLVNGAAVRAVYLYSVFKERFIRTLHKA